MKSLSKILASFFGVGLIPKAPGTFGSLAALALVYTFRNFHDLTYVAVCIAFIIYSIVVAEFYERMHGSHDAKLIVVDEVSGILVSFAFIPMTTTYMIIGFSLFRFFDIWKPFPVGFIDRRWKGGFGVVMDDVVAGMMTNICLLLLHSYYPLI